MVTNAIRMNQCHVSKCSVVDEEPNVYMSRFFWSFERFDEPLWDGCTHHSKLAVVSHVFTFKSDYELSKAGYDKIIEWERSILPGGNRLEENFYATKFMMKPLGLGY